MGGERQLQLPPLMVVQILSRNKKIELKTIKAHLVNNLETMQKYVEADEHEIQQYQKEIDEMQSEIHDLKTSAKTFQSMNCDATQLPLELPAVHFMCGHSYRLEALADEYECPQCSPHYYQVRDTLDQMQKSATNHEQFFKQ